MLPINQEKLSTKEEIKSKLKALQTQKDIWPTVPAAKRLAILDQTIRDFMQISQPLVAESLKAKGIEGSSSPSGEEWTLGPYTVLRYLRLLRRAYSDIKTYGRPRTPSPIRVMEDNQLVVKVFPQTIYDRIFFSGLTLEVWMEPGVTIGEIRTKQFPIKTNDQVGRLALILSSGNATAMAATDILFKLFIENHVVIVKTHPIQSFLRPFLEDGFRALIQAKILAIVDGGSEEGAYLCRQPEVDEIHIVGSHDTFKSIVSSLKTSNGSGGVGSGITKRVTAELECVSPFIIIPGNWNDGDIAYQAEHIVSSFITNAGFDCTTPRVIIQHAGWSQRIKLLEKIRYLLGRIPPRLAYYPNAGNRHAAFIREHPEAEHFGNASAGQLPWTLIPNLDWRNTKDICFRNEAFCSLFAETSVEADTIPEYIESAIEFANKHLFGDLSATVIIHPSSLKDSAVATSFKKAVKNLQYGTVAVNYWAGAAYPAGCSPWGSFAGGSSTDIQSGMGFVNNACMLSSPQKTVMRAPFRTWPKPVWFASESRKAKRVFPKLAELEANPSLLKVPGVLWSALRG